MVIIVEFGIYFLKFGGVRIEDIIVIMENGVERFMKMEREFI